MNVHLNAMRAHAQAHNIPVISPLNAAFLEHILNQRRPARVLEIGSAIGVSSAVIAQCIGAWQGQLTTLEISVPTQAIAQANMAALGLANVLSLCGDARAWLAQWTQAGEPAFDCIFIDAQKSQTHVFYEASLAMLAQNGLMIVDDAWLYRHKMRLFYEMLAHKKQVYSLHFVDGLDATLLIQNPLRKPTVIKRCKQSAAWSG